MSPLWTRPRLRVHLAADRLVACAVAGGRRAAVTQREILPLADDVAAAFDAVLAALPGKTPVEVVLGLPHVRYLMLPWDRQLAQPVFRQRMAEVLYSRQFQQDAAGQCLRFARPVHGQPLLAACIDRTLLTTLESACARQGRRLRRVEPLLACVWNRFQRQLPRAGRLWVEEGARVLCLTHARGAVTDVQLRPAQAAGVPGDDTCRFAPGRPEVGLQLRAGPGFAPDRDSACAFALCGVF